MRCDMAQSEADARELIGSTHRVACRWGDAVPEAHRVLCCSRNGRRRRCPWCPRWDAARQSGGALEGDKASERGADIGVHSRVPWSGIVVAWGALEMSRLDLAAARRRADGFDGAVREPRVELAETRSEVAAASRVDASHRSSSQRVAPGGSAGGGYRRQRVRPGV